ncbi:unnamed protein product [Gordionus sp. m RMFG-2023]
MSSNWTYLPFNIFMEEHELGSEEYKDYDINPSDLVIYDHIHNHVINVEHWLIGSIILFAMLIALLLLVLLHMAVNHQIEKYRRRYPDMDEF